MRRPSAPVPAGPDPANTQVSTDATLTAADDVITICRDLLRIDTSNFGDGSGPGERVAAEYVVRQRQSSVTFRLGELSEFAHDRAIATDVAEGQGNSEMHGRFLVLAGCWFPANL